MAITIIQGASKTLVIRIKDVATGDPLDLTGVSYIETCFKRTSPDPVLGADLDVIYLPILGDTASGSAIISNISDTSRIQVGQPISGAGIPVGATVISTPASSPPSATNTVVISANATATAAAVSLTVGAITIISAILGKINVPLSASDTALIESGATEDCEVTIIKNGVISIVQFAKSLNVVERLC